MEFGKLVSIVMIVCFSNACASNEYSFKGDTNKIMFKNYVLSICINNAYGDTSNPLLKEASQAANGYREFSNMGLDAYEAARHEISRWLKKDYSSKHGGQIRLMKCIDLYNSPALEKIFNQYDPCKDKKVWIDQSEYIQQCSLDGGSK